MHHTHRTLGELSRLLLPPVAPSSLDNLDHRLMALPIFSEQVFAQPVFNSMESLAKAIVFRCKRRARSRISDVASQAKSGRNDSGDKPALAEEDGEGALVAKSTWHTSQHLDAAGDHNTTFCMFGSTWHGPSLHLACVASMLVEVAPTMLCLLPCCRCRQ